MKRPWLSLILGCAIATSAACGKKTAAAPPAPQPNADSLAAVQKAHADSLAADAERRAREEEQRLAAQRTADSLAALSHTTDAVRAMLATMIHFDFDKSNIRTGDAAMLDQKIAILHANAGLRVQVAGHCDERGSDEYNLALGNRRASAAKQYLVMHGVEAGRIETMSYGKERPIAPGHGEGAWAQNRRDEFDILSGGTTLLQP
jgi:peptidoglycan-associated lipoprotein